MAGTPTQGGRREDGGPELLPLITSWAKVLRSPDRALRGRSGILPHHKFPSLAQPLAATNNQPQRRGEAEKKSQHRSRQYQLSPDWIRIRVSGIQNSTMMSGKDSGVEIACYDPYGSGCTRIFLIFSLPGRRRSGIKS